MAEIVQDLTDAARARLSMAYEACELAELARLAVPIDPQELRADGTAQDPASVLTEGARILAAAHRYVDAAVVVARLGGADWRLIAETLGVAEHVAEQRFEPAEARFGDHAPAGSGPGNWWRAHLIDEPVEAALDLDDWVLHHLDGEDDPGPTPVSGQLV